MGIKRVDGKVMEARRKRRRSWIVIVYGILFAPILVIGGFASGVPGEILAYLIWIPVLIIILGIALMPSERIEWRIRRKGWCLETMSLTTDREFIALNISLSTFFLIMVFLMMGFGDRHAIAGCTFWWILISIIMILWAYLRHLEKDDLYLSRCMGLHLEDLEESVRKILKEHKIKFDILPPYSFDNLVKYRLENGLEIRYRVQLEIIYIGPLMKHNRRDAFKLARIFDKELIPDRPK